MGVNIKTIHKYIVPIGDMHVKKEDIAEAKRLISWIAKEIKALNERTGSVALPLLMGDQYNYFGVVQVEVEEFWKWAYEELQIECYSASLIGNHDMNQDESASSMAVHSDQTVVIGKEYVWLGHKTVGIGFMRNEESFFVEVMKAYNAGARAVFCHAEFNGCQYENGFYAPHGFDLSRYPSDLKFYSGHIHMRQVFDKVTYFGTPRQVTASDIGEIKGIHAYDMGTGNILFSPTPPEVCEPITMLEIVEGSSTVATAITQAHDMAKTLSSLSKLRISVKGSKDFIRKTTSLLPAIKVYSTYTDEVREVKLKESEGIPQTFAKFSEDFFKANQVTAEMKAKVLNKIYESCPVLKGVT
jgi:hypothetical protein